MRHVALAHQRERPGRVGARGDARLLVLADQWYPGWNGYLDGKQVPIVRANYILRGLEVPAGDSTVVFRFEPRSFTNGVRLFLGAGLVVLAWLGALALTSWRRQAARTTM